MRILYATDGSEAALAGARFLARLPLTAESELRLVTVVPEAGAVDAGAVLAPAREVLRNTAARVETQVLRGEAARSILEAELARPTDLIVVGSRGLSNIERQFLGSVAERVARCARSSVVVARPLVNDLRAAILGFDGSERVARAAEWFLRFPLPAECEVRLLTVLPLLDRYQQAGRPVWPTDLTSLYQEQLAEVREQQAALVTASAKIGRRFEADVETGDPADTLLRVAAERRADLIVVGARGLSGRDRYLLGSVSEKVVFHAYCSVLVVR